MYLRCVLPNTCLCTASSSCQTRCSWPAAPAWSFPWLCTPLACHTYTVMVKMKAELRYCKFWGGKKGCFNVIMMPLRVLAHHSCNSGEGMRPAVPFFVFSSFPCHQLWSSLEMIWMMSPTRKRMPASLHGMSSSLEGSYSNCALT